MSVAKRLIEEQIEENARQEHELEDGAFYWVRRHGRPWQIGRYELRSPEDACGYFYFTEAAFIARDDEFAEIGPCLGKEPSEPPWNDDDAWRRLLSLD